MPRRTRVSFTERLARCVTGLFAFGAGIALIIAADLGLAPWDIFHDGLSDKLGIGIGWAIIGTGLALMLVWIPLRQRPGLGTLLNALEIGLVVNLLEPVLPDPEHLVPRFALLAAGLVAMGVGSGLYIGAGLGAGPRDGIMLGLSQRGVSVRLARTVIEVVVGVAGLALGGSIGIGTVAFAVCIGPSVQFFLPRFDVRDQGPDATMAAPSGGHR